MKKQVRNDHNDHNVQNTTPVEILVPLPRLGSSVNRQVRVGFDTLGMGMGWYGTMQLTWYSGIVPR